MRTLELLKKGGLEAVRKLGIIVKEYGDLLVLNYDQINSPKTNEVVVECRSLILERKEGGDFQVVSRAFDRFFNVGEIQTENEDKNVFSWKNAVAYEKLDGSLVKLYWYRDSWRFSTRGTAFADGKCQDSGKTYLDLILKGAGLNFERDIPGNFGIEVEEPVIKTLSGYDFDLECRKNEGEVEVKSEFNLENKIDYRVNYFLVENRLKIARYALEENVGEFENEQSEENFIHVPIYETPLDKSYTYIFELVSPENRIVTPYEKTELYLIGRRLNSPPYTEDSPTELEKTFLKVNSILKCKLPKMYPVSSLEEATKAVDSLKNLQEGFVVFDGKNRMKIKNKLYLVIHHKFSGSNSDNPEDIYKLLFTGEADEYLAYFPEKRVVFEKYKNRIDQLLKNLTLTYSTLSLIQNQKEFAQACQKPENKRYSSVFFRARKNGSSVEEEFQAANEKIKIEMVEGSFSI